jgi:hypothetical protein
MRIEITAETDAERATPIMREPWVRTGCLRIGLSGIGDKTDGSPTGEFGFLHGDNIGVRGDIERLRGHLDMQAMHRTTVQGLLEANQMVQEAQRNVGIAQEVLANGKPFRLHRP